MAELMATIVSNLHSDLLAIFDINFTDSIAVPRVMEK